MAGKRILVVDDEDAIREVVEASLELLGDFEVLTASCGEEGVREAVAERPDAVLLDVMMPDMDGIAVYRKLQEDDRARDVPVILLTAKAQCSDRDYYAEIGVAGVIVKPFDPMGLAGEVCEILGWK